MDINIKEYIISNFKDSSEDDIKASIEESIKKNDDVTLPGLGAFFQLLWENSDETAQKEILSKLKASL